MATSPRPGIIQLDHPNVYQAAKQAQQDDWVRRGINLAGDFFQERNRDIRYRRASGKNDDRYTTEDLVKQGLPKAWEGALGLLKAPFTEDVVTEKSYEDGVKTERPLFQGEMSQEDPFSGGMSREHTMSLAEPEPSGAVAVSFPTTVVGKDRVVEPSRREVGGKVDWDFPNKGYKTEFPTTVVGAPSTLKAPSAQPVGQKAPETPQNDAGATNDKVPDGMLQSPDWSEMYRLDPKRAEYDWNRTYQEQEKQRATKRESDSAKVRTQGLLKEVASDFANLSPGDQAAWDSTRANWISMDPNLAQFIPEVSNQDSWDRVQSQGGLSKNVAPKGEFARRKYVEDQVKQATFLSQTARASGKYSEADFYANKALEMQSQLDGKVTDKETVDSIVARYAADIAPLIKATTKDRIADATALYAKISTEIGEGAKLEQVKAAIKAKLDEEKAGKGSATEYSDEQQRSLGAQYSEQAKDLVKVKNKIVALKSTLEKIPAGAARIAAKELQGDVLAESEFSSYKNSDPIVQAFSNLANKLAGVSYITSADALTLVNALIEKYNSEASDYITAVKGVKDSYKNTQVSTVTRASLGGVKPPPGGSATKTDAKGRKYTVDSNGKRNYIK